MSINKEHTNCLRADLELWKTESGASYQDIADIAECSKSHLYEFMKGRKTINYELGKRFEYIVMYWNSYLVKKFKENKKEKKND